MGWQYIRKKVICRVQKQKLCSKTEEFTFAPILEFYGKANLWNYSFAVIETEMRFSFFSSVAIVYSDGT